MRDVRLLGRVADVKLLRDLCVGKATGYQAKDLVVAGGGLDGHETYDLAPLEAAWARCA